MFCMIGYNLMFSSISYHMLASYTVFTDKELDFEVSGWSTINTVFDLCQMSVETDN